jgi:hypothetical protein
MKVEGWVRGVLCAYVCVCVVGLHCPKQLNQTYLTHLKDVQCTCERYGHRPEYASRPKVQREDVCGSVRASDVSVDVRMTNLRVWKEKNKERNKGVRK